MDVWFAGFFRRGFHGVDFQRAKNFPPFRQACRHHRIAGAGHRRTGLRRHPTPRHLDTRELQSQVAVEKLQAAFEPFRSKELFFEDVVTADYDSFEKATLDNEGALVLAGVFKTDDMLVKYRLRFIQNNHV